jgi:MFS family permease
MVYPLAFAAVAPVAGAVSDFVGRRYLALSGTVVVITGLIVVGTAHRIEIGIAGMAITGVGAGITQTISVAGIAEIVPAKHRGAYLGTVYMCFFPMAPASAYGTALPYFTDWSYVILGNFDVEVGCMDSVISRWTCIGSDVPRIPSSTASQLDRPW